MASDKTDRAMLALTTFSDKLHRVAKPEAQSLDDLMRELRIAAQDERAGAAQQLNERDAVLETAHAERDSASSIAQAAKLELEMAQEEMVKLRQEVEHLEREARKYRDRERERRAGVSESSRRLERDGAADKNAASRESERTLPTANSTHGTRQREIDPRISRQQEWERVNVPMTTAPRRRDSKASEEALPPTGPSQDRRTSLVDSYKPAYTINNKRQRTDSDSGSTQTSPPPKVKLSPARKPACGACKKHGYADTCDGGVECGSCSSVSSIVCSYWLCNAAEKCEREKCTYLHPSQWSMRAEKGERRVKRQDGTRVSGIGEENVGL